MVDAEDATDVVAAETEHEKMENVAEGFSAGYEEEHEAEPEPTGLVHLDGKKINVVKDNRGVGDLRVKFPHVRTELLASLMQYYGSYTAVVDVLLALGDQLNSRRPMTAGFWDRQHWPRPGQLPSVFSWSVVDSLESYDVLNARDVERDEEDEWLDDLDEHHFTESLRIHDEHAAAAVAQEVSAKVEAAQTIVTPRYSEVLQRTPKHFAAVPPRLPPLVHLHPLRSIAEDEELSDSEDDGMESIIYRERYVMKGMGAMARTHNRMHVSPDVLAKKQQRQAQRIAAMR